MSSLSSDDPSKEEELDKDVDPAADSLMTKEHLRQRKAVAMNTSSRWHCFKGNIRTF
jgi:hypothetical protein